jgi:hypothetical protein
MLRVSKLVRRFSARSVFGDPPNSANINKAHQAALKISAVMKANGASPTTGDANEEVIPISSPYQDVGTRSCHD